MIKTDGFSFRVLTRECPSLVRYPRAFDHLPAGIPARRVLHVL